MGSTACMAGRAWADEKAFRMRAAAQHNVFSLRDWLDSGLTRGRLRSHVERGSMVMWAPRVYAIAGAPETFETRAMVGCKRAEPNSALFCASAAAILGLAKPTEPIQVATTRRVQRMEGYRFHRVALPPEHVIEVKGLPVTDCPRTLLDACGELYHRRAGRLIDRALRLGLCTLAELSSRCEEEARSGRNGINVMRELLALRDSSIARSRSDLEVEFFEFLDEYGFIRPVRNYLIDSTDGFPWEVDLYWPEQRRGIEVGTAATHGMDVDAYYKDQDKLLQLRSLGHDILVLSDRMLRDRPKLAEQLRRAGIPQVDHSR